MPGKLTAWPRPPDPRPGYFAARGFDLPIAQPWKILIEGIPPNTTPYSYFTRPVVVEVFLTNDFETEWNYRYGLIVPTRHSVIKRGVNPDAAPGVGWSVDFRVGVQLNSPGYYSELWGDLFEMFPDGGWKTKTITGLQDNLGSTFTDQVRITRMPWDTPTGFYT